MTQNENAWYKRGRSSRLLANARPQRVGTSWQKWLEHNAYTHGRPTKDELEAFRSGWAKMSYKLVSNALDMPEFMSYLDTEQVEAFADDLALVLARYIEIAEEHGYAQPEDETEDEIKGDMSDETAG